MSIETQRIVLVIDDSAEDRATYCRYLQHASSQPYQVLEADSATAGLALCQGLSPDLILLDYSLPDMDGLAFLDALRQQSQQWFPVLMLTGQGNERVAAQAIKRGAQDYLLKGSLTAEALCKVVAQTINQWQLQQQLAQQQQQQQILSAIALRIRQSLTLQTILDTSVTMVQQHLAVDRVLIYQFAPDMSGQIVAEAVLPEWSASLNIQIDDTCFKENLGGDYRKGRTRAIANIYEAGLTDCHIQLLERFDVKAKLVVPLLITHHETGIESLHQSSALPQLWGLLVVHQCAATRQWQPFETELLNQVAVQVAIAIQQAELYHHLQQLNQTLETRVQERTAQFQASEARLQKAQRIAHLGDWELNLKTQAMTWSEELFRLFGRPVSQGEPSYAEHLQGFLPESRRRVERVVQQANRLDAAFEVELRFLRPDGSIVWLLCQGEAVHNPQGEVVTLCGTALDITDRKQAETALQEREARLQRLATNIAGMIYQYILYADGSEAFTYVSPKCRDLYELEPEELQQNFGLVWTMIHPDDVEQVRQANLTSAQYLTEFEAEFRIQTPSGRLKWLRAASQPERQSNGNIIWDGLVIDITDRKAAALENLQLRERLQFLLAATPAIIYTCKAEGDYGATFVSENLKPLLGYDPQEFIADPSFWHNHIHPDDAPRVFAELAPLFTQGYHTHEYRFRHQDGSYRWMQDGLNLVRDAAGNPTEIVGYWVDVTDRKQAELALAQESLHRKTLLDTSVDGIVVMDQAGNIIEANASFANMLGYALEELTTLNLIDFEAHWTQAELEQKIEESNFCVNTFETRHRRKDGSIYHVEISSNSVEWYGQSVQFCICRDISDRKQAELALQESERRLTTLISNLPGYVYRVANDRNYTPEFISEGVWKITGYRQEEYLIDRTISCGQEIHPDDVGAVWALVQQAVAAQQPYECEYRITTKAGDQKWVWERGRGVYSTQGELLHLEGFVTEITKRKQAEAALQESEERFREIAHTIPQMFFVRSLNPDQYVYISPSYETIWGRSRDELLHDPLVWMNAIHPDDRAYVENSVTTQIQGNNVQREYRIVRPDGDIRWVSAVVTVIRDTTGTPLRFVGLAEDITGRKQAELALRAKTEELDRFFSVSLDLLCIANTDGYFLRLNPQWERVLGYRLEDMERTRFLDYVHPDDLDSTLNALAHLAQQQEVHNFVNRYRCRDGSYRWLEWRSVPVGNLIYAAARDITDRRQLEEALIQSRDFRERIFNESSDALFLVDADTLLTIDCNQRAVELFEVANKADLLNIEGQTLQKQQFTPEERVNILQEIQEKGCWSIEIEYVTRKGRMFWGELSAKRITYDGQQIDLVRVSDISDRKQAEFTLKQLNEALEQRIQQRTQELSQSEERLRLALKAVNQGLFDLNMQTGEAIVSPEYATMLGYDPTTFQETHEKWLERLHPDDREAIASTYRAYIAGEIPDYQVEFRLRTQRGHWKWILSVGKIVAWDEAGQPLRMLGTHTDIDDRKQADIALRESQRFLQTVLDTFPLAIWWKDRHSVYLGGNQKAAEAAGFTSPGELIGKTDYDMAWGATEADAYRADDREVMASGIAKLGIIEPLTQVNGSMIWIETNKLPLYNLNGELVGVMGTHQDITDRKRAETALQQLNVELEQRVQERTLDLQKAMEAAEVANRAKSRFLANMSHELRTPLNAILGFTQLMRHDASLNAEQQDYIRIMYRSGEHLLNLINDILDLSKIEAGRITLENATVNLFELLHDLQEMFRERAADKELQFNLDFAPGIPPYIETDPSKLRQVLINLLSNAIKFTQEGHVTLRVRADAKQEAGDGEEGSPHPTHPPGDTLVFEVEDTGVGIAPEELVTIFDAFAQAEAGRLSLEGTGLGLTISRRIVSLMGGILTVRSMPQQGSTFSLFIPLHPVTGNDLPMIPTKRRVLGLAPDQPTYRILVVDDQPDNRKLLTAFCTQLGLEVRDVASGQEAIDCWQAWQPHLIWMDIRMPQMDGCETTRRLRAAERLTQPASIPDSEPQPIELCGSSDAVATVPVPILALTAQADVAERARALEAGCNDFVSKPVQEETLLAKMTDYLGLRYQYEEIFHPGTSTIAIPLTAEALRQGMPTDWLQALHQAALHCDEESVSDLIQQIPASKRNLLEGLTRLAHSYQFELIMQLTQAETQ